jgi:hypothetical protein
MKDHSSHGQLRPFTTSNLPKWQLEIINQYPSLYLERDPGTPAIGLDQGSPCHLRYVFECDAGWAALIREVSDVAVSLMRVLRSVGFQGDARIIPCVVKEKLGGLRWQAVHNLLSPFRELFQAYVFSVEQKSTQICERSGKHGQLRQISGRLVTLSEEEYEKELRRKTSQKA